MSNVYSITLFGIIFIFIASFCFYVISIILCMAFRSRNKIKEEEIAKVVEKNKTKYLENDEELIAVITGTIMSYRKCDDSSSCFKIKSIKEVQTPSWGLVERFKRASFR